MKRFVCLSILLAGVLADRPAHADGNEPAGQAVSGIFQGVDVGGTPRRHKMHSTGTKDSFAVSPGAEGTTNEYVSPEKHVQARQMMVPSVDDTPSTGPAPVPVESAPAQPQAAPSTDTLRSAGASSAEYYQSVIDQVKATSAQQGNANGNGKFKVSNKDRF